MSIYGVVGVYFCMVYLFSERFLFFFFFNLFFFKCDSYLNCGVYQIRFESRVGKINYSCIFTKKRKCANKVSLSISSINSLEGL